jgi:BirA family biotin operon repressor/biotin-[acetyl-CoA-carboxylase] ligase
LIRTAPTIAPDVSPLTVPASRTPALPPLLTAHRVPEVDDPVAFALSGAGAGRLGAGDTCWSDTAELAAAAIVLEPEGPLSAALEMAPLMLVAIGDALGAIGPPNLAVTYRWPLEVLANGGEAGCVSIRVPEGATPSAVPDFLVVGFSLSLVLPAHARKAPGRHAEITALHEEGCGDLDSTMVIEAVCRHFVSWIDGWQQDGFRHAHPLIVGRMSGLEAPISLPCGTGNVEGRLIGIEAGCTALVDAPDRLRRVSLADALGFGA